MLSPILPAALIRALGGFEMVPAAKGNRTALTTRFTLLGGLMANQTLYKIRSLDNWKFVLDIIVNSRLFAAPFESLNDPMEGRYYFFGPTVSEAYRKALYESKLRRNICSFSERSDSTLLWSYYAGGHTGVAFGVQLPTVRPRGHNMEVRAVRYDSGIHIGPQQASQPPDRVALEILTQKQSPWAHEREVRVFTSKNFVPVKLKELVLGHRISAADEKLLRALMSKWHPKIRISKIKRASLDHPEAVQPV
jgi:hypothetical protein